MAKHLKVSLEHHLNRRYHVISHGRGRRPEIVYGRFNLRFRQEGKRIRLPLESVDLTAALKARSDKEAELNAAPVVERKGMLQSTIDKYLIGIKAGRKKKTFQAYDVALRYLVEAIGNKDLTDVSRLDLLAFRTYLKETKHQSPRSQYNKFENVATFLKQNGISGKTLGITSHDWPQFTEEEPEIYEQEVLDKIFAECDAEELLRYEFFLMTGMREQEVIYATDRCVDFASRTVSVKHNPAYDWSPKMYKERTIDVPQYLIDKLKAMLVGRGKGGLLFPTANGLPKFDFLDGLKAIARRAGIDEDTVWLHKFRSTFCTRAIWATEDFALVQRWMGHEDVESTMRYARARRGVAMRAKVESIWAVAAV